MYLLPDTLPFYMIFETSYGRSAKHALKQAWTQKTPCFIIANHYKSLF